MEVLYRLNVRVPIEPEMLRCAFLAVLEQPNDEIRDVLLGQFLGGLMAKGPTASEVAALVRAALSLDEFRSFNESEDKTWPPTTAKLISTVGSGKKGVKTINVSTASALVQPLSERTLSSPDRLRLLPSPVRRTLFGR